MKIYYFSNGEIWNSILKRDEVLISPQTGTQILEIDEEVPENSPLISSLSTLSQPGQINLEKVNGI